MVFPIDDYLRLILVKPYLRNRWLHCIQTCFDKMYIISHTTSVGMTLISHTTLVGMTLISHTTSVGMTLILVSFFLIILIILATNWSSI